MKFALVILIGFGFSQAFAQMTFQKYVYNDVPSFSTIMSTSVNTSDGGILSVGTNSTTTYSGCLFVVKTDSMGKILWSKHYDTMYNFVLARDVIETHDNGCAITGKVSSASLEDAFILRLDDTGKVVFAKRYGGAAGEGGFSIVETPNRSLVMVGGTSSFSGGMYILKTDSVGSVLWSKVYSHTAQLNSSNTYSKILTNGNEGYFIASESPTGNVPNDLCLMKLDTNGVFEWGKSYGGIYPESLRAGVRTSDGGFLLGGSGRSFTTNHTVSSGFLIKTDSIGNLLWTKHIAYPDVSIIHSIQETKDHSIIISAPGKRLIKLDEGGNFLWAKYYGTIGGGYTGAFESRSANGYWLAATVGFPSTPPGPDYYLVRTDDSGNSFCLTNPLNPMVVDTLSLTNSVSLIFNGSLDTSNTFSVYASRTGRDTTLCSGIINSIQNLSVDKLQVYPNPSSGIFTFFSATFIESIEITSITGKSVYVSRPNSQRINVNLSSNAPGIYFYTIKRQGKLERGKILLQ